MSPPGADERDRFSSLVLDVWREACRHIRLEESIGRISRVLTQRLPLGTLLVRRLDLSRSQLETVAVAESSGRRRALPTRTPLTTEELDDVLLWARRGEVLALPTGQRRRSTTTATTTTTTPTTAAPSPAVPRVLPDGVSTSALAGPLTIPEAPTGVLVLLAEPGATFDDSHLALCRALLEPFAAAMENDRRLTELEALREAAEAERRSLLTRLGGADMTEAIVGADTGLREVVERVRLVATSDVPVLLLGETGSGKEVVARSVHRSSARADGPFLRVNCGAIPSELVDSELFGHERGSFTGAEATRHGWFERAHGGTLFLDEIGELAPAAQVRLLRVLQDGTFERVGGQHTLHVDVRVVAATHRDLHAMAEDGRFRRDLWYRVAVFPISVPPLRERRADIPSLATHFALKAAKRFGTPPLAPSPADMSLLISYPWPGNVRELVTVMERAVILGNGRTLEVATALGIGTSPRASSSPPSISSPFAAHASAAHRDDRASATDDDPSSGALSEAMARHIRGALQRTRGRIEGPFGAAALLDINPHTLRSRMRRLGIDWRGFRARGS